MGDPERRKRLNRESAKRSSDKKKAAENALNEQNALLKKGALGLAQELVRLRAQVRALEHALAHPPPPLAML